MSSSTQTPGTVANYSTGAALWLNTAGAKTSNNNYAYFTGPSPYGGFSYYLKATNYGFSLPPSTINGIKVQVEKKALYASVYDSNAYIIKGGSPGSSNRAKGGYWSGFDTWYDYGGASDLWSLSWTYSDINASNFGFMIKAHGASGGVGYIDCIRIVVYYTPIIPTQVIIISDDL